MPIATLYDPEKLGYGGMFSAQNGAAVSPGRWMLGQNIRIGDKLIRARYNVAVLGAAGTPTDGTYPLGSQALRIAGTLYGLHAFHDTPNSVVRIYKNIGGSYTQLTATSGQYGDTTLSDSNIWPIEFVAVKDPRSGKEYAVILSANDTPRVYDPATGTFAEHQAIDPPSSTSQQAVTATFPKFFTPKDATSTTHTNVQSDDTTAQTNWVVADASGSTTESYLTYTRNTSAESNPRARTQWGAAIDLSACRAIGFLFDTATPDFWDRVQVDISEDGSTWTTVWKAGDPLYSKAVVWLNASRNDTRGVVQFSLDHVATGSRNAALHHRVIYLSGTPAAAVVCKVYAVVGCGKARGQSYHAITYGNSASRAESLPLLPRVQADLVSNCGGPTLDNLRFPYSEELYYNFTLPYLNTTDAQRDLGVDTLFIYRNDPGDPDPSRYSFVTTVALAAYAGSWAFSSGTALSILTTTDSTPSESRNTDCLAPFPGCLPIPSKCRCGAFANDRLIVGRKDGTGSNGLPVYGELWASELGNPFRFYRAPYQGNPASGGKRDFAQEYPTRIVSTPSGEIGVDSLWQVTSESLLRSDGYDLFSILNPRYINDHGTIYRDSVAHSEGTLYWLDKHRNVMRIGNAGFANLSQYIVSDQFSTVTDDVVEDASGVCFNNTYRLSFATAGSGDPATTRKNKTLIWWPSFGVWSVDNWASLYMDWLFTAHNSTIGDVLYAVNANDKKIYAVEYPSQSSAGAAVSLALTTPILHTNWSDALTIRRASVLIGDASSGTIAWTATYFPDGSTRSCASTSIDVSSSYVWRDLPVDTGGGTGLGLGIGAQVAFTFSVPGGTPLLGLTVETEKRDLRAKNAGNTN